MLAGDGLDMPKKSLSHFHVAPKRACAQAPERRAEARACWEAWCRAKVESERALAAAGGGGAAAPESEDLRKTVPRQRAGVVMTSFEHEAWVQSKREGRLAAERARTEADEWLAGQQAAYLQQRLEGHEARLAAFRRQILVYV